MTSPSIVWLRQDLRLHDHPPFVAAAQEGPVIPVYILDDDTPGRWRIGGAQRWWLHHSLLNLHRSLEQIGSRLILRRGESVRELKRIASEMGIRRVHATQHYEPWWREAEQRVGEEFNLVLHAGNVLVPPEEVRTGTGMAYKIYTPYWRALQEQLPPSLPLPAPERLQAPEEWPRSEDLDSWALLPVRPNWAAFFGDEWSPGEAAGLDRLNHFVDQAERYSDRRDLPSEEGTSRFSPHLHFGELSQARLAQPAGGCGRQIPQGARLARLLAKRDADPASDWRVSRSEGFRSLSMACVSRSGSRLSRLEPWTYRLPCC